MYKFFFFSFIFIVSFVCSSCMSENDKKLRYLFKDIGLETTVIEDITQLVIIPGYGCSRCIARANADIHVSHDTLYVMVCRSEKDFRLLTGNRKEEFPNVFLDKEETSIKMKLVKSIPMIYTLKQGKFISCEPFLEQKSEKDANPTQPQTTVSVDKYIVNWENIPFEREQRAVFILTNTGKEDMIITNLVLSCECMKVEYAKQSVSPGDTLHLCVTFRPDVTGEFMRDMYVYGNFNQSPIELEIKGSIIK